MDNNIRKFIYINLKWSEMIWNLSQISTTKLGERINCSYKTEAYYFKVQRKTKNTKED